MLTTICCTSATNCCTLATKCCPNPIQYKSNYESISESFYESSREADNITTINRIPKFDGKNAYIAINNNIADGTDVSWINQADFEKLSGAKKEIVVTALLNT